MKDFTKRQARAWVAQEAGKHLTPASRTDRITTEQRSIAQFIEIGLNKELPNAFQAHWDLIKALMSKDAI
jgi:hypothetical protein